LRDLNVPVYGTRFTLALVKKRSMKPGFSNQQRSAKSFQAAWWKSDRMKLNSFP